MITPVAPMHSSTAVPAHTVVERRPPRWLAAALVLAGYLVYLAMNHPALWTVYHDYAGSGLRTSITRVGFISVGYAVLLTLLLSTRRVGVTLFSIAFGVSVLANFIYSVIFHGSVLTGEVVEWLIAEYHQAPSVWVEFQPQVMGALAMTLLAMAALMVVRHAIRRVSVRARDLDRGAIVVVPALAFLALQLMPLVRPVPFALAEANLYTYGIRALAATAPEPRPPTVLPERVPFVEKIVLVVDESVTYRSYLSAIAPVLAEMPALDYGEAASIANCSAATNALLRWGVEKPAIGNAGYDPRATPHLWGYARAAGMRTTLIDGQSWGFPQNFLFPGELRQIDEFVPAFKGFETDHIIAALLNERLRRPGRAFIYVVKRGAHFPYKDSCPPGMVSPQAAKSAQHAAAVRWSCGGFFESLSKDVDFSRVLLVYTSDHGQDFEARATHCSSHPRAAEYSVPLVVLTRASPLEGPLRRELSAMHGHASHANIFPTLLYAMGYARAWTESMHGPTLAGPPAGFLTLRGTRLFPFRNERVQFSNSGTFPGRETDEGSEVLMRPHEPVGPSQ